MGTADFPFCIMKHKALKRGRYLKKLLQYKSVARVNSPKKLILK